MIRNRQVGWTTIYINGRTGAEAEILHHLRNSGFNFMPGYANEKGLMLFWVDEVETLRSFKKAIGSKTIFKYRLRFYTNVEAFVESRHNEADQQDLYPDDGKVENDGWPTSLDMDTMDRLSA